MNKIILCVLVLLCLSNNYGFSINIPDDANWKQWISNNYPDNSASWSAICKTNFDKYIKSYDWDYIAKSDFDKDGIPTALMIDVKKIIPDTEKPCVSKFTIIKCIEDELVEQAVFEEKRSIISGNNFADVEEKVENRHCYKLSIEKNSPKEIIITEIDKKGEQLSEPFFLYYDGDTYWDRIDVSTSTNWKSWLNEYYPDISRKWPKEALESFEKIKEKNGNWDFIGKGNYNWDKKPTALFVKLKEDGNLERLSVYKWKNKNWKQAFGLTGQSVYINGEKEDFKKLEPAFSVREEIETIEFKTGGGLGIIVEPMHALFYYSSREHKYEYALEGIF
ncbi:MAG: hypothetical protein HY746_05785 [Elusimicrobia bacterium]|nr:hypothetical protein [Elusimicrobiota bacterium]